MVSKGQYKKNAYVGKNRYMSKLIIFLLTFPVYKNKKNATRKTLTAEMNPIIKIL